MSAARATARARRHGARFALFGGVGAWNTLVDFAVYGALVAAGLHPTLANVLGFAVANAQSYVVNARITFREEGRAAQLSPKGYARFLGAHSISLVISTAGVALLSDSVGPLAAKGASALFTAIWNYSTSAFIVFRGENAPAGKARG